MEFPYSSSQYKVPINEKDSHIEGGAAAAERCWAPSPFPCTRMSKPSSSSYRTRAGAGAGTGAGAGAGGSSSSDPAVAAQEMEVMETTTSSDDTMMMMTMMREHMFDKVVTPSDVGKLNRLVIPKQHAERYFPLDSSSNEKGLILNFEDRGGKCWRFRYSYWNSSQSYVMTKGWSRFVKEKKLDAGDIVSFQRGVGERGKGRFYIDWRRRRQDHHHHHPQHNIHHRFPHHHHHQYYINPPPNNNMLLNQLQHGSWSCTTGVATTPPLFAYASRPQPSSSAYHLPPALPLRCFTRDHSQSHLSQIMMMATTTTTTTATTSGISNIGPNSPSDDQYRYLHNYITHPNDNNITSNTLIGNHYQHCQTHQYHHPQSNTCNQQYLIHHGTALGVGGGTQTQTTDHQMQTARYINNIMQGTTNTSSSSGAVVFDSVPVVQYGKTPKRLRLFGVNMDCPISSTSCDDNDEDDNDDDEEDEVDDIDIDNQDDQIQGSYCNNNVSNYGSTAPPPLNYHQQQQKQHYHEQISSTPLQLRLYNGACASPLPFSNAISGTSTAAVRLSSANVDSITDKGKSSMSLDFDI